MAHINITFKENNKGTYDFKVVQNGLLFFKKEYTVSEDNEGVVTQAQVFSGFTHYLQTFIWIFPYSFFRWSHVANKVF